MNNEIQFLLYNLPDDDGKIQVVIKDENIWCTQKAMAQLFGVGVPAISKHLNHIFEEGELNKDATVSKMEIVVNRGFRGNVSEQIDFYNLDGVGVPAISKHLNHIFEEDELNKEVVVSKMEITTPPTKAVCL